jgi:hypothetical protein
MIGKELLAGQAACLLGCMPRRTSPHRGIQPPPSRQPLVLAALDNRQPDGVARCLEIPLIP